MDFWNSVSASFVTLWKVGFHDKKHILTLEKCNKNNES